MTVICTIGYEGAEIGRFIETLKAARISVLADVRAIAASRRRGFSKTALAQHLSDAGIIYRHFVALGDPKAGRLAARAGRYAEFRAIYAAHLDQPVTEVALRQLALCADEQPTCLLCYEREPESCHRSMIIERLGKQHFSADHLFVNFSSTSDVRSIHSRHRSGEGAPAT